MSQPKLYGLRSRITDDGHYQYEIAPNRWVSRQRVYQLRNVAKSGCMECGRPVSKTNKLLCSNHRDKKSKASVAYKRRKRLQLITHVSNT